MEENFVLPAARFSQRSPRSLCDLCGQKLLTAECAEALLSSQRKSDTERSIIIPALPSLDLPKSFRAPDPPPGRSQSPPPLSCRRRKQCLPSGLRSVPAYRATL